MQDRILLIKTGALGDVLRTTSILRGLKKRSANAPILWITAPGADALVRDHPLVDEVVVWDGDPEGVDTLCGTLGGTAWEWILSFDDETGPARLATRMADLSGARLSGALEESSGALSYTEDVEPWFGMGLLSRAGKEEADRRKLHNERSHAELFSSMLGIEAGKPMLVVPEGAVQEQRECFQGEGPLVGLNTGAGDRWPSKGLDVGRTTELAHRIHAAREGDVRFLILGGELESKRNAQLLEALNGISGLRVLSGGTDNSLLEFAAQVACCSVLVSSDSLAMHMAIAQDRPVVAFFAPTSAAEVDLFGRGRSIRSTASDYCSYRPNADNSSITPERLCSAVLELLNE